MFKYYLIFALVIAINLEVESFILNPSVNDQVEPNNQDPPDYYPEPDGNPADPPKDNILAAINQLPFLDQDVINNAHSPNVEGVIGSVLQADEAYTKLGGVNFLGQISKFHARILNGMKLKLADLGLLGDIVQVILSTLARGLEAFFAIIGTPFRVVIDCLKAVFKVLRFAFELITLPIRIAIISVLRIFDRSVFMRGFNNVVNDLIQFLKTPKINSNLISKLLNKLFGNRPITANHFNDLKLHLFPVIKLNPNGVINALSIFKIPAMVASGVIVGVFKMISLMIRPFPNFDRLFVKLLSMHDFNSIQNPAFVRNKLKSL